MATNKIDKKALALARAELARSGGLAIRKKLGKDYFRELGAKGGKARGAKLAVDKNDKEQ